MYLYSANNTIVRQMRGFCYFATGYRGGVSNGNKQNLTPGKLNGAFAVFLPKMSLNAAHTKTLQRQVPRQVLESRNRL